MTTLILAFIIFSVLLIGMSIGVIMGRKPIKGSCGGVGKALGEENYQCKLCDGDESQCEKKRAQKKQSTTTSKIEVIK